MKVSKIVFLTAICIFLPSGLSLNAMTLQDESDFQTETENSIVPVSHGQIIGTWELVSARYNGVDSSDPVQFSTIKIVTPDCFAWFMTDKATGMVLSMASGNWKLNGTVYTEYPMYGMGPDFPMVRNQSHVFNCDIIDGTWMHNGFLKNGLKIEQVWKRK